MKQLHKVRFQGMKGFILLIFIVLIIVGYYYHINKLGASRTEEDVVEGAEILTATQRVLLRDLDSNYPPTPREVVKYFSEVTQCFYNEENTEEEITALGKKIRQIYDDELVANQTEAEYLEALRLDIQSYKDNNRIIASYSPSSSVDVETFTEDGHDWARLYCQYGIRQGELLYDANVVFVLRKDENDHYKIFGWRKLDSPNKESIVNP